jgi:hypothetical protein
MPLSYNPLTWQGLDLSKTDQARLFLTQLSATLAQLFGALNSAGYVAAILNGSASLSGNALSAAAGITAAQLTPITLYNSAATGTVNLACDNATTVTVHLGMTGAVTLNLTHLPTGTPVFVVATNGTGGALNLTVAATQPGGAAYVVQTKKSGATTLATLSALSLATITDNLFIGHSSITRGTLAFEQV